MRERLWRLRQPSAWPAWVVWIVWLIEKAGDADWVASKVRELPMSTIIDFAGSWGWLFGTMWIAYIVIVGARLPFQKKESPVSHERDLTAPGSDDPLAPGPVDVVPVLYEDRPPAGKDFASEIASGRSLWVAIFAGTHLRNQMMLDGRSPIARLLLVHPRGAFVEQLALVTNQTIDILRANIEETTRYAQQHQVPVRWFDGPFINCVITDPLTRPTARVEMLVPYSAKRPNVIPDPEQHEQSVLIRTIRDSFEETWKSSVLPNWEDAQVEMKKVSAAEWSRTLLASEQAKNFLAINRYQWRHNRLDDPSPYVEIVVDF